MAHDAIRSQRRRLARIRADATGRPWVSNAERRRARQANRPPAVPSSLTVTSRRLRDGTVLTAYVFAPLPATPVAPVTDKERQASPERAMTAGRIALRRSRQAVTVRDRSETFLIVS